jgi:hypothetical protein
MRGGTVDQRHDHAEAKHRPEDVEREHRPEEDGNRQAEAEQPAEVRRHDGNGGRPVKGEAGQLRNQRHGFSCDQQDEPAEHYAAEARLAARQALIDDGPEGQCHAEEVHPARERLEHEPEWSGRPDFAAG